MSFILSIILARILLPSEYGIIAMVMVFINIANVFTSTGFGEALVQKKDADELDFSTVFFCTLSLSYWSPIYCRILSHKGNYFGA